MSIPRRHLLGIFAVALLVRLAFASVSRFSGGDWWLYSNIAQNIYDGCGVAYSFGGRTCMPHFGGNQLPLFPAFAALCWKLSGHNDDAIRVAQAVLASAAILRMTWAVGRFTESRAKALAVGLALAISPLEAVWTGWLVTETLAIATTTWVMAELLICCAEKRLRIVPVAAALTAATWVRMDGILLLIPSLFIASQIVAVRQLHRWLLVPLLVGATCLAWSARNVAVGLPALPRPSVLPSGLYQGRGYFAWVESWVTGELVRADMLFRDQRAKRYYFPDQAFANPEERRLVMALHARVMRTPAPFIPDDVNQAFFDLAAKKRACYSPAERIALFAKRLWSMTARTVLPLPVDIGDGRARITPSDLMRFAIFWGAVVGLFVGDKRLRLLATLGLGYFFIRAIFFAAGTNLELRYMVEAMPMLIVTTLCVTMRVAFSRKSRAVS